MNGRATQCEVLTPGDLAAVEAKASQLQALLEQQAAAAAAAKKADEESLAQAAAHGAKSLAKLESQGQAIEMLLGQLQALRVHQQETDAKLLQHEMKQKAINKGTG